MDFDLGQSHGELQGKVQKRRGVLRLKVEVKKKQEEDPRSKIKEDCRSSSRNDGRTRRKGCGQDPAFKAAPSSCHSRTTRPTRPPSPQRGGRKNKKARKREKCAFPNEQRRTHALHCTGFFWSWNLNAASQKKKKENPKFVGKKSAKSGRLVGFLVLKPVCQGVPCLSPQGPPPYHCATLRKMVAKG